MSKEAIVEKIISDAHLKADSIVAEANAKADEIIAKAAEECKEYLYSTKSETDRMVLDVDARSKTVAELDAKKLTLAAKTKVLDVVYERVLENLRNLDEKTYSDLIFAMLDNAKKADAITNTLTHIMEGLPTDCSVCALKDVCEEVEGMKELHFGIGSKGTDHH